MIAFALIIGVLEVMFSTTNTVEEDSWKLTNFEDFVYSASSLMEAVGLVHGVGSFFIEDENNRFSILGLPLVVISNGVWEDVKEIRMSGFRGTIIQATCAFVLLVVWFCLIVDWGYIIVVVSFVLVICYFICPRILIFCFRPHYYDENVTFADVPLRVLPLALTRDEVEIPVEENPIHLAYVILLFSPVVIEILESIFLLRNFSLSVLGLLMVDVFMILPGVLWMLVQVRNICKERFAP